MKTRLTLFAILLSIISFGQELILPPATLEKDEAKIKLFNEFAKESKYENSIKRYVSDYLFKNEDELKITYVQVDKIKDIFDYKTFAEYSIYTSLQRVSIEKISKLIEFYKSIDGEFDDRNSLFLTNQYDIHLLQENILHYVNFIKKGNK